MREERRKRCKAKTPLGKLFCSKGLQIVLESINGEREGLALGKEGGREKR